MPPTRATVSSEAATSAERWRDCWIIWIRSSCGPGAVPGGVPLDDHVERGRSASTAGWPTVNGIVKEPVPSASRARASPAELQLVADAAHREQVLRAAPGRARPSPAATGRGRRPCASRRAQSVPQTCRSSAWRLIGRPGLRASSSSSRNSIGRRWIRRPWRRSARAIRSSSRSGPDRQPVARLGPPCARRAAAADPSISSAPADAETASSNPSGECGEAPGGVVRPVDQQDAQRHPGRGGPRPRRSRSRGVAGWHGDRDHARAEGPQRGLEGAREVVDPLDRRRPSAWGCADPSGSSSASSTSRSGTRRARCGYGAGCGRRSAMPTGGWHRRQRRDDRHHPVGAMSTVS